jgi:hypothetical protein
MKQMLQAVDGLLEAWDLRLPFTLLVIAGVVLAVFVVSLTNYEAEDGDDPAVIRFMHRLALGALTYSLLWCLSYSFSKNWQPWPPSLAVISAVDLMLLIRAIAIKSRIRRHGVKMGSPRFAEEHRRWHWLH